MQRMCENGTLFRNAYSPSPLCLPARSAYMSGRRVHEIDTYNNCNVLLDENYPSFGAALREQGVHTVMIGKTDVYAKSADLGFSELLDKQDRKLPGDINFPHKPVTIREGAADRASGFGVKETAFDHDIFSVDEALRWLDSYTGDENFVIAVSVHNPHFPQYATQEYWDMYDDGLFDELSRDPAYSVDCETARHPYAASLRAHFECEKFTKEQARGLLHGYRADVSFVDTQLGRLLDKIESPKFKGNTNLIYTADHGDMMGRFGMWWKCALFEDSARIPCLAVGPSFAGGVTVNTPVDLLDVSATLFRLTGAEMPEYRHGVSLTDIPVDDSERVVFAEYHGHGVPGCSFMIRKGAYKLLYFIDAPHLLFNLADDPHEMNNLYEKEPAKAKELTDELLNICDPAKLSPKVEDFIARQWREVKKS